MRDKFGQTAHKLERDDANNPMKISELLKRKNGFYVIFNQNPGNAQYTDYVDAITNGECIAGAYTTTKEKLKSVKISILD